MQYRTLLLAAASAVSLTSTAAIAQTATTTASSAEVQEIVVTGTRTTGRSRLDTLAPVDVVTSQSLQQRGVTELASALASTVPSISFPRPSNTDGTDAVRPATLRGQGPDQTLVLVNGTRRHVSALLNTNGSVGRGSAAVDLNAIPSTALERIEVLRDGAAAQYGSDAIAGVVNLRLREAASGGGLSVTYGQYETQFDGFYGRDGNISDGGTTTVAGWQGLPLGADGFLTLSAEYRDRENTNRSDIDTRVTPNRITSRFGDADVEDVSFYANAGKPLGDVWEAYGWFGVQERDASSAATYRLPTDASQNVPSVYPNGYVPKLATDTSDLSAALGLRGEIAGFNADFNIAYGKNDINFGVRDTINPSFGAASQTSFEAGGLEYSQTVVSADFSRGVEVGMAGPLNVAFGVQARTETFEINQGEPASYSRGPITTVSFGSRGFTGFTPSNEVDVDRDAVGVYVDLEGQLTEKFSASGAVRYEDYSDFGSNTSGKISARYDFTPAFALRGAASTGFRAPSLQQQYYTATSILYINGVPFETGTYPSVSPIGVALGGQDLDPETSRNYSLGLVYRQGAFELTVDAYRIEVEDRIVLSETFQGSATAAPGTNARVIADLLAPFGATAARFFINGVDTETNGVDVVARYRIVDPQAGTFDLTAAGNINEFEVTKTPTTSTSILPTPTSLFGRQAVLRFEEGTPKHKLTLQGDWSREAWGATLRTTFYGSALSPGTLADGSADTETGNRGVVDFEARRTFPMGVTLALGADNLFDVYPRQIEPNLNTTGAAPFSSFSPFGFNGRFVYGRMSVRW
ncbi:TonB-dependent siderophore receptor [Phenylobacterium sp.]|uniref:TonB-dependent receptor plug domain-containing protein n=1 Tax=Phenylobacterium sp. TaxID=1871053 RepID=UPI00273106DC|nr:TonB-dependent receptor [Phenylobacterium sp.]MDP1618024.1 TonB-dependent receptor [Phenylobacterium sp.]MDP1987987.1 TonB-dependent receptor [Phenylobacterium sp.]